MAWLKHEKNYPQVYLEECKYKSKKINITKFISTELESEPVSQSDSKPELESDAEIESKSELESDT